MKKWDIIGDIHGQASKLETLLGLLGYIESNGVYRHPERRVLFLGDYIDRGPAVRRVLQVVRAMVEAGEAVALMGNHELNALLFHTLGGDGQPLRPHSEEKTRQHMATLVQFLGRRDEWRDWLTWFAQLPLCHETEDFRAVHACWSDAHFEDVRGCDFRDPLLLEAAADKSHPVSRALDILLKGPEVKLPRGAIIPDKDGHKRKTMRVRWWGLSDGDASYRSLIMPPGAPAAEEVADPAVLASIPDYPEDAKTVFCGHYWLPYEGRTAPLTGNIMCLDYSAGKGGPLVACRWNGSLEKSEFRMAPDGQTLLYNIGAEVDRYFDDSSATNGEPPRILIFVGGPAAGKTTLRRRLHPNGFVIVDAAEIFGHLSRGELFDFPGPFAELLDDIGKRVAERAILERRNIFTELIGADKAQTQALLDAMLSIGYRVEVTYIHCDIEVALQRNTQRGEDNISAYYCEPYQRSWLCRAAQAFLQDG